MKRVSPSKVAAAAVAGLLVLGSGLAAAGACLSDDSGPEQTQAVTSGQTDAAVITPTGVEVEDHDADEVESDDDTKIADDSDDADHDEVEADDDADEIEQPKSDGTEVGDHDGDDDSDEVEVSDDRVVTVGAGDDAGQPDVESHEHPDNHGKAVSEAARNKDDGDANHGAKVSGVAHDTKGTNHEGDDEVAPPADGTGSPVVDRDDDDQDEVEADHDEDENDDDQGVEVGGHHGERSGHDADDED